MRFEPSVGVGLEYTDNAMLVNENKVNDLIAVTYVGAHLMRPGGDFIKLVFSRGRPEVMV